MKTPSQLEEEVTPVDIITLGWVTYYNPQYQQTVVLLPWQVLHIHSGGIHHAIKTSVCYRRLQIVVNKAGQAVADPRYVTDIRAIGRPVMAHPLSYRSAVYLDRICGFSGHHTQQEELTLEEAKHYCLANPQWTDSQHKTPPEQNLEILRPVFYKSVPCKTDPAYPGLDAVERYRVIPNVQSSFMFPLPDCYVVVSDEKMRGELLEEMDYILIDDTLTEHIFVGGVPVWQEGHPPTDSVDWDGNPELEELITQQCFAECLDEEDLLTANSPKKRFNWQPMIKRLPCPKSSYSGARISELLNRHNQNVMARVIPKMPSSNPYLVKKR